MRKATMCVTAVIANSLLKLVLIGLSLLTPLPSAVADPIASVSLQTPTETGRPSTGATVAALTPTPELYVGVEVVQLIPATQAVFVHHAQLITPLLQVGDVDSTLEEKIGEIEQKVCTASCHAYPVAREAQPGRHCQPCYCDTACNIYGDCCPNVQLQLLPNITLEVVDDDEENPDIECLPKIPMPISDKELGYDHMQQMLVSCPRAQTGSASSMTSEELDTKTKCEHPDVQVRDLHLPVSSADTNLTYRNIYCALCNEENGKFHSWSTIVDCQVSAEKLIHGTRSQEELWHKLVTEEVVRETLCYMTYSPPASQYSHECNLIDGQVVNICNATGQWSYYDADIKRACGLYMSVFHGADGRMYRNMFCYLCNLQYIPDLETLVSYTFVSPESNVARVDFAALLDFRGQDASFGEMEETKEEDYELVVDVDCGLRQYYDIVQCGCRELECSEGKYLNANGTCESLLKTNLLGYRACLRIDAGSNTSIESETVDRLQSNLNFVAYGIDGVRDHSSYVLEYCPGDFNVSLYLINNIWHDWNLRLEDLEEFISVSYQQYKEITEFQLKTITHYSVSIVYPCLGENDLPPMILCPGGPVAFPVRSATGPLVSMDDTTAVYYIAYTQTSQCSFVSLPLENFTTVTDTLDENEMLEFGHTGQRVAASRVTASNKSNLVRVCLEDYKHLIATTTMKICAQTERREQPEDTWTVAGLVSIICTCISLLCLALTFASYALLPQLRAGGGKNIMTLTVLLFIAQALYEFGIEQYENAVLCRVIGVLVHYSWLAAVFSCNACTIERFLKLRYPLATRAFFLSGRKPFLLATTYALLCPAVIVLANILASLAIRNNLGYGTARLCYINTQLSRIVAFAVPMGIVLLFNVALLAITLWSLRRRHSKFIGNSSRSDASEGNTSTSVATSSTSNSSGSSVKGNKVGLLACVRLSVVTGLTWLFAFLYEAIPSDGLSYAITALIGLQGVIFFLSLIANFRVFRQLKDVAYSLTSHSSASTRNISLNDSSGKTKKGDQVGNNFEAGEHEMLSPKTVSTLKT